MSSKTDPILVSLNPAQHEAVTTLEGPMLIVAGAGSGKTRVVTHRIANLIHHGVRPWQILAITFTNKAADEMRRRVEGLVGSAGVWLSTFHSFCARLLRMEAEAMGISRDYSIYDEDDAKKVLGAICNELLGKDEKRLTVRSLRALISMLKSSGVGPDDLSQTSYQERIVHEVYTEYEKALRNNQAFDFDDLLLNGVRLLRDHREVRERYCDRFRHILIDEYQDTNSCQYELVKLLAGAHRNVCATGDPDQSIYSWRGADIRNILSFEKDFPNAKVVRLEQNYRSTKRILAVASQVIAHNTQRKERALWTENPEGEKVKLLVLEDQEMEAEKVASCIEQFVKSGRAYKDCAIFYRTNAQSRPFEATFLRHAIPYQIVGGTPFYDRREVRDALAYLRLIVNPKDDISFRRIINVPKRAIGASTVERISKVASGLGCSLLEALDQHEWIERDLKPKPRAKLYEFARMMDRFRKIPRHPVEEIVRRVLEESGLLGSLLDAEETDRIENLEQLLNAAAVYDRDHPRDKEKSSDEDGLEEPEALKEHRCSLPGFLEHAALVQPTDDLAKGGDHVAVMTLHMAKGLEFPFVFLVGVEDDLLPMAPKRSDFDEIAPARVDHDIHAMEEERRLFYVGVTRGEERVFLTRVRFRMRYGRSDIASPSPFLDEIPEEHLEIDDQTPSRGGFDLSASPFGFSVGLAGEGGKNQDVFAAYLEAKSKSPRPRRRSSAFASCDPSASDWGEESQAAPDETEAFSQLDQSELKAGDKIEHSHFGRGTILAIRGPGHSAKAEVHFQKAGKKTLLLAMARLRRL